ncbi:hypothetical protein WQ54_23250 [Bacillus sp. SA1-12]|nr:hypothetical protein WQ54_23250 [Bacillus sp. SA1-12]
MVIHSCKLSEGILNQYATRLIGEEICFKVHYWGVNPGHFNNILHKHSFFEVCYVLSGEGLYHDQGGQFQLKKGSVFISRPNIQHQILSESGLFLLFVAFEVIPDISKDDAIRKFDKLSTTNKILINSADDTPTALIWRALVEYTSIGGANECGFISNLANTLVLSFHSMFSEEKPRTEHHEKLFSNRSSHLYQAKLFIRDNLSDQLRLEHVANNLHISTRHLSRLFSEELGESFSNYIRRKRIEEAAKLLETTNIPIKEIADLTGCGSVHSFTRMFTSMMNVSPAKYRNTYEIKQEKQEIIM